VEYSERTNCTEGGRYDCSSKLLEDANDRQHLTAAPDGPGKKDEWTFAIDLTLNSQSSNQYGHIGAEEKSAWLKAFAAQTKNKPIALVVQVHHPDSQDTHGRTERYVIRNGRWQPLAPPEQDDPAANLGDLLEVAGSRYPSNKLGLLVFSHGFAYQGLGTDNGGKINMSQLSASVDSALTHLDRPKLDIVGYDNCLMGEADVLSTTKRFAKRVVASPELLPCHDEQACGLDLTGWFGKLVEQPDMTANEFGNAIVEVTRANAPKFKSSNSPSFVGNYGLGASFETFESSLNKFGNDLAKAIDCTIHGREKLQELADETQNYDRYFWNTLEIHPKDLVDFVQRVKSSIASGAIQDQTGELNQDADAILNSYSLVLGGSYASPYYDAMHSEPSPIFMGSRPKEENLPYDKLGGLSVFLPNKASAKKLKADLEVNPQALASEIAPDLSGWRRFVQRLVD
jgi:hypothetical protein